MTIKKVLPFQTLHFIQGYLYFIISLKSTTGF